MKKLLLLSTLLLIFSCQKEGIDLRDDFTGTYTVSSTLVGMDDTGSYTDESKGSLTVKKGVASNELVFNDFGVDHPVFLDGNAFTVTEFRININGDEYIASGKRSFGVGQIQYVLDFEAIGFFDEGVITIRGRKQ